MNRFHAFPSALFVTVALSAAPAFAEGPHSRGSHENRGSQARPAQQAENRREAPAAAQAAPRTVAPRFEQRVAPRVVQPRVVSPRVIAPRIVGRPYYVRSYYVRPYYAFRPHFSIGFGLWLGYPVAYPYYYPYPVPYPDPYPSGYPYGSVSAAPTNLGGLSFDITPNDAEVFVDGRDMGRVADFGPSMQPLSMAPGRHYVEVRANGYQTMVFDADVMAGQVLPYQGTMRPE